MNEVIKIVGDAVYDVINNADKYPDKEYGKLREFLQRLLDLEYEVEEEADPVKKVFLQAEFDRLESCTKTFCGRHILFALRSGLNVHAEFHLFPSPVMYVCFEPTQQKRKRVAVKFGWFQDDWFVIDDQVFVKNVWNGNSSDYSKYSEVKDMTMLPNLVFDEEALKVSGVPIPDTFNVAHEIGEKRVISIEESPRDLFDTFFYQKLNDYSDYVEDWFNQFFVPWYILTFVGL